ncbi:MAG: hypothetical protein K0S32_3578 [Bacteroidetes bacterium]|jgi:hypothetical protein|nr:hypothetical protein [Bacteroidota bacterium]
MFSSEVQNKNALQRTLMSHRTMTESAQWPVGAVSGCLSIRDNHHLVVKI